MNTATIGADPRMIAFYNEQGNFMGSCFVCVNGTILSGPTIAGETAFVTWQDNSSKVKYMSYYSLKDMAFQKIIQIA